MSWAFAGGNFTAGEYSREHAWEFDGGVKVPASSSPHVVKLPYSNAACVDPEEAFVAAISSCHLLTYLYLAAKRGFEITSYTDEAVGSMTKNEQRRPWISRVVLRPDIRYVPGRAPSPEQEHDLHEAAHEQCFIANSVKTEIVVEPRHSPGDEGQ